MRERRHVLDVIAKMTSIPAENQLNQAKKRRPQDERLAAMGAAAGLHSGLTEGTWMARIVPDSTVARAFSHIDWDLLVPYATGGWAAGYAIDGDSVFLTRLIEDIGYGPVRVGSLAESGSVDPGGRFWSRTLTADAMRAELASLTH